MAASLSYLERGMKRAVRAVLSGEDSSPSWTAWTAVDAGSTLGAAPPVQGASAQASGGVSAHFFISRMISMAAMRPELIAKAEAVPSPTFRS